MPHGHAISDALTRGEIEVHYQPQVVMDGRGVMGSEALARWRHPRLGLLTPDHFMSQAEEDGVIGDVDEWVRHRAIDAFCAGRLPGGEVTVNMSPFSLDPGVAERLVGELAERRVHPNDLVVDLSERVRVREIPDVVAELAGVARVGVRVALDDLGSTNTSVMDLAHLPVQRVKLDRSLTAGLTGPVAPRARLATRAIAALAEHLGMEVMAEGVETAAQEEVLLDEGIRLGQGFLYGRPAPLAALV